MAPRNKVEFSIIRLSYAPHIDCNYPKVISKLKERPLVDAGPVILDWFDRVMSREIPHLPQNLSVCYKEWRIYTGGESLFKVNSTLYDRMLVIMGENSSYWCFYQKPPLNARLEGDGDLRVSYCNCCLHKQYLKIIQTVKSRIAG